VRSLKKFYKQIEEKRWQGRKNCRMHVCCSSGTWHVPGITERRMSWRGRYELSDEFLIA
jgi:hypothetical protein